MTAIFVITDGTTVVDLLAPTSGFHLVDWTPAAPRLKGGGVWRNSPMAHGRQMVSYRYDNTIDTFALQVNGLSQDAVIRDTQDLRRLMVQARDYWTTNWQKSPVWIEARGACETETRYATIMADSVPNDDNPFLPPFAGVSDLVAMDSFTVTLEHDIWQHLPPGHPGTGECTWGLTQETLTRASLTNKVLNPGFETPGGGGADIWLNWVENAGGGALANGAPHSGANGCQITAGAALDTYVYQDIAVVPGAKYLWSFWARGDGVNSGRYQIRDNTAGFELVYRTSTGVTAATYAQVSVYFYAPSGCVQIRLYHYCSSVNGGVALFDDNILARVADPVMGKADECDRPDMLSDGGFEVLATGVSDWQFWSETVGAGAIIRYNPAYSGVICCSLTGNAANNTWIGQTLYNIVPGDEYTLDFWVWNVTPPNKGRYAVWDMIGAAFIVPVTDCGAGAVWTEVTATFIAPAGCTSIFVEFFPAAAAFVSYFDDASLIHERDCVCEDDSWVYLANKDNIAQLTDVYYWDNAPGVWSGNLLDAGLPQALLPAVPAANDTIYLGIDSTLTPTLGPFCSAMFDLIPAPAPLAITWEYWNGGWVGIPAWQDNTIGLTATGLSSLHWAQPTDWAVTNPNPGVALGVTGWWIRGIVTVGAATPPYQQHRNIYTAIHPEYVVHSEDVGGDIEALAHHRIACPSQIGATKIFTVAGVMMSVWSTERDLQLWSTGITLPMGFSPFINLSDIQNHNGVTVTATGGAFVAWPQHPTGRCLQYAPGAGGGYVEVGTATPSDVTRGIFRVFMRTYQVGGAAGNFTTYLNFNGGTTITSPIATTIINNFQLYDFGVVEIPPQSKLFTQAYPEVPVPIRIYTSNLAAGTLNYVDLILMPVDELAIEVTSKSISEYIGDAMDFTPLDVDGISFPIDRRVAHLGRGTLATGVYDTWRYVGANPPMLRGHTQKVFFLEAAYDPAGTNIVVSPPETCIKNKLYTLWRYLSMRGNR